jgi:ABC-2 type transport system permease protein
MNNIGFLTFASRELRRFLSIYNQTIVPGLLVTVLYIVVFGKSLGGRIGEIKNSASSLLQGKLMRFLDDILITPLSGMEISLGYILGGALRGVLNGILVLVVGLLMTSMPIAHPVLILVFLAVVGWTFGAAGLLVGIFAKTWDNIQLLVNFFLTPLVFLGGVFYSIDMLPPVWRTVSLFNPLYYMVNGLRYAVLNVSDTSPWWSLFLSVAAAALFTILGATLFAKGYRIKD